MKDAGSPHRSCQQKRRQIAGQGIHTVGVLCGILVAVLVIALVACAPAATPTPVPATEMPATPTPTVAATPTAIPAPTRIVIGMSIEDTITYDPEVAYENSSIPVLHMMYDTLVTYELGDFSEVKPSLATSWDISPDAKTYTFHLGSDVKFTSGNPLTSEDVRWSFERLRNIKASPSWLMEPVESIEIPDPHTVVITLTQPDVSFLSALAGIPFSVVDSKTVQAHGGADAPDADQTDTAREWLTQNSAGTGPYMLVEYVPKDHVVLVRNPNSWRPPGIDEVFIQSVPESSAQKMLLQRGDIDLAMDLTPEQVEELRSDANIVISAGPSLQTAFLAWTRSPEINEPLSKPEVGQAIKLAIDWEGLQALIPGSVQMPSIVPVEMFGSLPLSEGPTTDLERARELLAQAGYPDGFTATLTASATMSSAGVRVSDLAEKLQSDLGRVGIDVQLELVETGVWVEKWRGYQCEMSVLVFVPDFPDPANYLGVFNLVAARVQWTYEDDLLDLMNQAAATTDKAEREAHTQEALRLVNERANFVALPEARLFIAHKANVKGVVPEATYRVSPQFLTLE